jgi:hypothetical protein
VGSAGSPTRLGPIGNRQRGVRCIRHQPCARLGRSLGCTGQYVRHPRCLVDVAIGVLLQVTAGQVQGGINYGTFWFALALVNAALAQLQGRRGLEWFLASLLFGPFATLLLVLQYKKKP